MAVSLQQFGDMVKAKYPQYEKVDSATIGSEFLAKNPEFRQYVHSDNVIADNPVLRGMTDTVADWLPVGLSAVGSVIGGALGTTGGVAAGAAVPGADLTGVPEVAGGVAGERVGQTIGGGLFQGAGSLISDLILSGMGQQKLNAGNVAKDVATNTAQGSIFSAILPGGGAAEKAAGKIGEDIASKGAQQGAGDLLGNIAGKGAQAVGKVSTDLLQKTGARALAGGVAGAGDAAVRDIINGQPQNVQKDILTEGLSSSVANALLIPTIGATLRKFAQNGGTITPEIEKELNSKAFQNEYRTVAGKITRSTMSLRGLMSVVGQENAQRVLDILPQGTFKIGDALNEKNIRNITNAVGDYLYQHLGSQFEPLLAGKAIVDETGAELTPGQIQSKLSQLTSLPAGVHMDSQMAEKYSQIEATIRKWRNAQDEIIGKNGMMDAYSLQNLKNDLSKIPGVSYDSFAGNTLRWIDGALERSAGNEKPAFVALKNNYRAMLDAYQNSQSAVNAVRKGIYNSPLYKKYTQDGIDKALSQIETHGPARAILGGVARMAAMALGFSIGGPHGFVFGWGAGDLGRTFAQQAVERIQAKTLENGGEVADRSKALRQAAQKIVGQAGDAAGNFLQHAAIQGPYNQPNLLQQAAGGIQQNAQSQNQ